MGVPVKLLGFCLLSLHCVRCQNCPGENIKYENTEPLEKASYSDGETLRVNCMTGYTGLYKLKCEKGEWKATIERHCAKKKCSHPGDTPNGDFKLTEGTEFVFGATVVYTCKKGYEMANRFNQRTCRAQGWDNAIPICEVVKCPAIRTDGDVTASGNTEEGNYGDVIHFECVSSEKMIDGSSDIHCKETGKWSEDVPKCKEITCKAPPIENGEVVNKMPEYRKGATLEYKCNKKFKKREGIPKCSKFGWTIKPECDEVTCSLQSTTFGIKKINPEGKTIFRVGEMVEITCSEKYMFFFKKDKSRSFTCQDNGNWDHNPVCTEITCEVPRDQHVLYPYDYFNGNMKLGKKIYYYCERGYDKMETEATCTEDGWTPNPLCAKTCVAPNIQNAKIVKGSKSKYPTSSRVEYQCLPRFEPEEPVEIICDSRTQWTGIQQCTEKMCAAPNIQNAKIVRGSKSKYPISSSVEYQCLDGFEPEQSVTITCDSQYQWTDIKPCTVKQKLCSDPSVDKGWFKYIQPPNKEKIFYSCNRNYKAFTGQWWDSATCSNGLWSDEPRCIPEEECGALPSVNHGKPKQTKQTFHNEDTTQYECDPGFIPTPRFIKCNNGTWEKPVCKEGVRCGIPPKVENAVITSKPEEFYVDGSNVTYICRDLFVINGESMVFCRNGEWEKTPTCEEPTCEYPRDQHVSDSSLQGKIKLGEKQSYSCERGYHKMAEEAKCTQDGWEPKQLCTETCPLQESTTEDLQIEGLSDNKERVKPGTKLTFSCTGEGMRLKGAREITCKSDGKWTGPFPKCIENSGKCGKPPRVDNSDTAAMEKNEYNTGEWVEYKCFDKYVLDTRSPFSSYLTCDQGEWSGQIKCLKPCTVTEEIMNSRGIQLRWSERLKMFAPHNDHITFSCQMGKKPVGTALKQTCNDGDMTLPQCE